MTMMMEENSSIKSAVSSMVLGSSAMASVGGGGGIESTATSSAASSEIHQQMQHDPSVNATTVSVRIYVPELNVQKVIHFHREELVWNVKQQCLASLPKVSFFFFSTQLFLFFLLFARIFSALYSITILYYSE